MNRLRTLYQIIIWGLCMSLSIGSAVSGQDWKFEKIDTGTWVIRSAIDVDHNGFPHIVYRYSVKGGDDVAKYTFWDGSSWHTQLISRSGYYHDYVDIALDTKGNAHIVYPEYPRGQPIRFLQTSLWYTVWDGETKKSQQEIDKTHSIYDVSIALDGSDYPHICYEYNAATSTGYTSSELRYATWNGVNWEKETIARFAPGDTSEKFPSIAVDQNNVPHVIFFVEDAGVFRYAKQTNQLDAISKTHFWADESVDFSSPYSVFLALDSNGFPHVSYYNPKEGQAKYARWDGNKWIFQKVEAYGEIALDDNDVAYILYGRDMKIGIWNGIEWQSLPVNGNFGYNSFSIFV